MRRIVSIVLLCLLALVPTSCKKAKLRAQLKELMGSTIVLPEKITCVYNGEVYPMPDSVRNKRKLIVFVDSTECSKCRMSRFIQYEPFLKVSDSSGKYEVLLLLSIKEAESEELIEFLSLLDSPYPVFIDSKHEFLRINSVIPADPRFHSMLIDGDGRPLLFGDPASGDRLKKLFFDRIYTLPQ